MAITLRLLRNGAVCFIDLVRCLVLVFILVDPEPEKHEWPERDVDDKNNWR